MSFAYGIVNDTPAMSELNATRVRTRYIMIPPYSAIAMICSTDKPLRAEGNIRILARSRQKPRFRVLYPTTNETTQAARSAIRVLFRVFPDNIPKSIRGKHQARIPGFFIIKDYSGLIKMTVLNLHKTTTL